MVLVQNMLMGAGSGAVFMVLNMWFIGRSMKKRRLIPPPGRNAQDVRSLAKLMIPSAAVMGAAIAAAITLT